METIIKGKAFVLGNNIDTDQIIPAEHLVYSVIEPEEVKKYGHFALSGVPLDQSGLPYGHKPFIRGDASNSEYSIIIGGSNFGCGSSREHAPFALQVAGIKAVIAESYARIFYRNSVDGGFLIPYESEVKLTDKIRTGDLLELNVANNLLLNHSTEELFQLRNLGNVLDIVKAGNLFEFARKNGMITSETQKEKVNL